MVLPSSVLKCGAILLVAPAGKPSGLMTLIFSLTIISPRICRGVLLRMQFNTFRAGPRRRPCRVRAGGFANFSDHISRSGVSYASDPRNQRDAQTVRSQHAQHT